MKNLETFKNFNLSLQEKKQLIAGSGGPGVDSYAEFLDILGYLKKKGHTYQIQELIFNYNHGYYDF